MKRKNKRRYRKSVVVTPIKSNNFKKYCLLAVSILSVAYLFNSMPYCTTPQAIESCTYDELDELDDIDESDFMHDEFHSII